MTLCFADTGELSGRTAENWRCGRSPELATAAVSARETGYVTRCRLAIVAGVSGMITPQNRKMGPSREIRRGLVMAEQSGQVRVRVVNVSMAAALQGAITNVLQEEQASGAEVIDIKLTSTPAVPDQIGSGFGEYVALIILR